MVVPMHSHAHQCHSGPRLRHRCVASRNLMSTPTMKDMRSVSVPVRLLTGCLTGSCYWCVTTHTVDQPIGDVQETNSGRNAKGLR